MYITGLPQNRLLRRPSVNVLTRLLFLPPTVTHGCKLLLYISVFLMKTYRVAAVEVFTAMRAGRTFGEKVCLIPFVTKYVLLLS